MPCHCWCRCRCRERLACQYGLERNANVRLVRLLQNEVGCAPGTITANQYRNLFVGQAALAGRSYHSLFFALERFKEKGLVRFGNTNQSRGLLFIGQRKKTIAAPILLILIKFESRHLFKSDIAMFYFSVAFPGSRRKRGVACRDKSFIRFGTFCP